MFPHHSAHNYHNRWDKTITYQNEPPKPHTVSSSNLDIERLIDILRYIFPVLSPLSHAFGEKVLYLPVDRAEVVLRPRGYLRVQLLRQAQRYLFLLRHP